MEKFAIEDGVEMVTIAIPTIGRVTLHKTLESILAQDYTNWEVIISDNLDSIEAKKIVAYFNDPRIKYIGQKINLGPVGNPNFCLSLCNYEYLVIMHDDDYFHPSYLSTMVNAMNANRSADWAICNSYLVSGVKNISIKILNPRNIFKSYIGSGADFLRLILEGKFKILMPVVMYRKNITSKIRFDSSLVSMCDLKMWLDLSLKYNAVYIDEPIFYYRIWDSNGSIDRVYEGQFFRDALFIIKWLKNLDLKSINTNDLKIIESKIIRHQCMIIIWMLFKHPKKDINMILSSLETSNSLLVKATSFIIRHPIIHNCIGYVGLISKNIIFFNKRLINTMRD